jgi:hypothetical protein
VVEYHTTLRFAWLRQNKPDYVSVKQGFPHPFWLVRFAYNAVFRVFLLPFFISIGYGAGFIAFTVVLVLRFTANLATNNFLRLTPRQYEAFPFRMP